MNFIGIGSDDDDSVKAPDTYDELPPSGNRNQVPIIQQRTTTAGDLGSENLNEGMDKLFTGIEHSIGWTIFFLVIRIMKSKKGRYFQNDSMNGKAQ